jgi:hypothetical protein
MGPIVYDKTLNCVLKISGFNDITLHKRQSIQHAVRPLEPTEIHIIVILINQLYYYRCIID